MPKLTKSEYTPREVRQVLADLLQEKIDDYGTQLLALRKREVGRAALAKGDLCLLCAQLPGDCNCMKNLRKASAEQVNNEMKGFKSIASSPTFGGGSSIANAPKEAPRAGNGTKAASGVINNAKAEKKTRIPRLKKTALAKRDGAATAPAPAARPPASGVPGKQPVGAGGGDSFKVPHAATTASLNDVRTLAPSAANATKDKAALPSAKTPNASPTVKPTATPAAMPKAGMHPETKASLAAVKAAAPAPGAHPATKASLGAVAAQAPKAAWGAQGLPGLKAKLQNVQASHAMAPKTPPAASPAAAAARPTAIIARPGAAGAQLAADKRAGGVGFLNNLLSRFRRAPAAAAPTPGIAPAAATPSARASAARFHGALPLQRSEQPYVEDKGEKPKPKFDFGKCAMCSKAEHMDLCKDDTDPGSMGSSDVGM